MLLPQPGGAVWHVSAPHVAMTCRGPAGRAASSALLTAWDMGLAHAVRLPGSLHSDLRPPSCAQFPPPVQGLKLPGSTRDADGDGDSGSPEARAPAQHSEYGGGLAAGSGWQGSLLCPIQQDRQLPTLQGSPVPCQSPEHCRAWNRSWALSQSSSWLMSPLKGAGWEQPGTCRGHPLPGTEELLPPGTARRGNLTALYKYRGVGACEQAI